MRMALVVIAIVAVLVAAFSLYLLPKQQQIGQALEESGRFDEALEYYTAALRANPLDEPTWVQLAGLYLSLGRPEEAIKVYRYLVDLDPDDPGYRKALALYTEWNLDMDEAMAQNQRIAALDPRDVGVRQELASYYVLTKKDYAAAVRLNEEIVALRPNSADALQELARLYAMTNRIQDAIATYQRALDQDPSNLVISRDLGRINAWSRQMDEAIEGNRATLQQRPNDRATLRTLKELLTRVGQTTEAEQIDRRLAALPPE